MPPRRSDGLGASFAEYSDHPLFPVEEGEANPQVTFIQITRHDRGVQKYGPVLRAEELTTTDELFEMFGGGHYELWARGPSKMKADGPGNITRKRRFVLPGRPKPLSKDPTPEELREIEGYRGPGEAAGPSPAPAASSSAAGGMGDNVLVAILTMQQQASQQFMALMMEMMKSSRGESSELAKAQASQARDMVTMLMTMSGQQQQSMVAMMTAMMTNRGGGPEEMAKYAKLLKDLGVAGAAATKEGEGEGEGGFGKMLEDAADFVQGIAQLKGSLPAAPGAESAAPNGAPAPPGSAAAVAEAMLPKT